MIRSWKYPTRLVMVIRVPIGAFLRFFLSTGATFSGDSNLRSKWRSSLGVLTRSLNDLSASLRISKARTVRVPSSSSSEEPDSSELVSIDARRSSLEANFSDRARGSTADQGVAGLVPLGVFDPPKALFSSVGDMASPGSFDEMASPQLFCLK
jgi:hypothetical protein